MVSFEADQAEGLRRILGGGSRLRVFTFLSATTPEEKGAMLFNLGASLLQGGSHALLLDACRTTRGIASGIGALRGRSLLQVAQRECMVDEIIEPMPQGFSVAALMPKGEHRLLADPRIMRSLEEAFHELATHADVLAVDAELNEDDTFPLPVLARSEIVVLVSTKPDSITTAYALIKRVSSQIGKRPFSILVTGASDSEAQTVYKNMAQAANRYLSVKLNSLGSIPADEHLARALRLGRAVVDAFPLAGASVAFRRLASRFALPDPEGEFRAISANGVNLGA